MPDILGIIAKYGYSSLFAALLMEAIGLPVPGALALLAAGAASASGVLHPAVAFAVAIGAMVIGTPRFTSAGAFQAGRCSVSCVVFR